MRVVIRRLLAAPALLGLLGVAAAGSPAGATELGNLLAAEVCGDGFHMLTESQARDFEQSTIFSGEAKTNDGTFEVTYRFDRDFASMGCQAIRVNPSGASKMETASVTYSSTLKTLNRGDWTGDRK